MLLLVVEVLELVEGKIVEFEVFVVEVEVLVLFVVFVVFEVEV
jgi:hypothetical protein